MRLQISGFGYPVYFKAGTFPFIASVKVQLKTVYELKHKVKADRRFAVGRYPDNLRAITVFAPKDFLAGCKVPGIARFGNGCSDP